MDRRSVSRALKVMRELAASVVLAGITTSLGRAANAIPKFFGANLTTHSQPDSPRAASRAMKTAAREEQELSAGRLVRDTVWHSMANSRHKILQMSRPALGRRLIAVLVAAAAVLAGAGTLAPAEADVNTGAPAMTANNGAVNIAVDGPNHSLLFYWAVDGSPTWHVETVAGPGTTYSPPAMIVNGNNVNIVTEGPDNSLMFYWAVNGSPTWNAETVAGPGTTFDVPAITTGANVVDIAAKGPDESLMFYWARNGSPTWNAETVLPALQGAGSAPSITIAGNDIYIAFTGILDVLGVVWQPIGSSGWTYEHPPAPPIETSFGVPGIAANGNTVDVTYTAYGQITFLWSFDGSSAWNAETVDGTGNASFYSAMPIAAGNGSIVIAATTRQSQLMFYWAAIGTGTWHAETVAGLNSTLSSPSITLNGNAVNISAIGPGGELDFYWALDGTATWNPEEISGGVGLPLP